jgi:hypothetical protein
MSRGEKYGESPIVWLVAVALLLRRKHAHVVRGSKPVFDLGSPLETDPSTDFSARFLCIER